MPIPTTPYASTDFPRNYFSGQRRITQDQTNYPTLSEILGNVFDRIDVQSGRSNLTGAGTTVAITLPRAYADTNYTIIATSVDETGGGAAGVNVHVTAKATTGFTLNVSGAPGAATISLHWFTRYDE
jgi:hypothetical protein